MWKDFARLGNGWELGRREALFRWEIARHRRDYMLFKNRHCQVNTWLLYGEWKYHNYEGKVIMNGYTAAERKDRSSIESCENSQDLNAVDEGYFKDMGALWDWGEVMSERAKERYPLPPRLS